MICSGFPSRVSSFELSIFKCFSFDVFFTCNIQFQGIRKVIGNVHLCMLVLSVIFLLLSFSSKAPFKHPLSNYFDPRLWGRVQFFSAKSHFNLQRTNTCFSLHISNRLFDWTLKVCPCFKQEPFLACFRKTSIPERKHKTSTFPRRKWLLVGDSFFNKFEIFLFCCWFCLRLTLVKPDHQNIYFFIIVKGISWFYNCSSSELSCFLILINGFDWTETRTCELLYLYQRTLIVSSQYQERNANTPQLFLCHRL